jgi:MerR family transcriptional regulator, heat shock protein HspR
LNYIRKERRRSLRERSVRGLSARHAGRVLVQTQSGPYRPKRTDGGTRRYSRDDIDRINEIAALLETGLNHEGVRQVMKLRAEADDLRRELESSEDDASGS